MVTDVTTLYAAACRGEFNAAVLGWLREAFTAHARSIAAGTPLQFERCLHLPRTPDQLRRAERDLLLRDLAADLTGTDRDRARVLRDEVRNFITCGPWRFWRDLPAAPPAAPDRQKTLHRLCVVSRGKVLSERQVQRRLDNDEDIFSPRFVSADPDDERVINPPEHILVNADITITSPTDDAAVKAANATFEERQRKYEELAAEQRQYIALVSKINRDPNYQESDAEAMQRIMQGRPRPMAEADARAHLASVSVDLARTTINRDRARNAIHTALREATVRRLQQPDAKRLLRLLAKSATQTEAANKELRLLLRDLSLIGFDTQSAHAQSLAINLHDVADWRANVERIVGALD